MAHRSLGSRPCATTTRSRTASRWAQSPRTTAVSRRWSRPRSSRSRNSRRSRRRVPTGPSQFPAASIPATSSSSRSPRVVPSSAPARESGRCPWEPDRPRAAGRRPCETTILTQNVKVTAVCSSEYDVVTEMQPDPLPAENFANNRVLCPASRIATGGGTYRPTRRTRSSPGTRRSSAPSRTQVFSSCSPTARIRHRWAGRASC